MIYLMLYLVTGLIVGAVVWHILGKDPYSEPFDLGMTAIVAAVFSPLVIVAATIIIPIRILAVKIGPVVDAIAKHVKENDNA